MPLISTQERPDKEGAVVLRLEMDGGSQGQAQMLGVAAGDILTSVNGCDLRLMNFREVCALLAKATFPRNLEFERNTSSKIT